MEKMKLPLFFSYTDVILSNEFIAGVRMVARVTAENDGSEWWFNGVNPGAIAECGVDRGAAALAFRGALRTILFQFAGESATFDDFKAKVVQFFNESDPHSIEEWAAAREAVRAGQVDQPDFRRETGDPTSVHVELLKLAATQPKAYAEEDQPRYAA